MLKINFFRDNRIIERIRDNDRSVLGEIYVKYEKLIFSYINSHGGNNDDAADMLQEAIIVLWQNVNSGKFELSAQIGTFLVAVAKNKWRKELRKRSKIADDPLPENKNDEKPDQLEILLSIEEAGLLQEAFNLLKPLCKRLLLMFYFEERSLEEITEHLEFSNTNVTKSKKYQCKKSLEAVLNKHFAEPERRNK